MSKEKIIGEKWRAVEKIDVMSQCVESQDCLA
jgi:hypothetical protein